MGLARSRIETVGPPDFAGYLPEPPDSTTWLGPPPEQILEVDNGLTDRSRPR